MNEHKQPQDKLSYGLILDADQTFLVYKTHGLAFVTPKHKDELRLMFKGPLEKFVAFLMDCKDRNIPVVITCDGYARNFVDPSGRKVNLPCVSGEELFSTLFKRIFGEQWQDYIANVQVQQVPENHTSITQITKVITKQQKFQLETQAKEFQQQLKDACQYWRSDEVKTAQQTLDAMTKVVDDLQTQSVEKEQTGYVKKDLHIKKAQTAVTLGAKESSCWVLLDAEGEAADPDNLADNVAQVKQDEVYHGVYMSPEKTSDWIDQARAGFGLSKAQDSPSLNKARQLLADGPEMYFRNLALANPPAPKMPTAPTSFWGKLFHSIAIYGFFTGIYNFFIPPASLITPQNPMHPSDFAHTLNQQLSQMRAESEVGNDVGQNANTTDVPHEEVTERALVRAKSDKSETPEAKSPASEDNSDRMQP